MPVAKVKGEFKVYYEEVGSGPRSLVVLGTDDATGAAAGERLANEGVRVVRYDPRGVGRTSGAPPVTSTQHSADLGGVLRVLKVLKPTILASGDRAPIAVAFASRHLQDIRRLILVSPKLAPTDETKLSRVGEKAVVMADPDVERVVRSVL